MSEWLYLTTTRDANGNPRRLYVEVDDGEIVTVVDEGYEGPAAARRAGMPARLEPPTFRIVPSQYNELHRMRRRLT